MLQWFKKKDDIKSLQKKYEKLMGEWHKLSTINRAASDAKYAEAEAILKKIDALKN